VVDAGEADPADEVHELAEEPLVDLRPRVALGQDAAKLRVLLLDRVHCAVEEDADVGLLRALLEIRPAGGLGTQKTASAMYSSRDSLTRCRRPGSGMK